MRCDFPEPEPANTAEKIKSQLVGQSSYIGFETPNAARLHFTKNIVTNEFEVERKPHWKKIGNRVYEHKLTISVTDILPIDRQHVVPKVRLNESGDSKSELLRISSLTKDFCILSLEFWSSSSCNISLEIVCEGHEETHVLQKQGIGSLAIDLNLGDKDHGSLTISALVQGGDAIFFLGGSLAAETGKGSLTKLELPKFLRSKTVLPADYVPPTTEPISQQDLAGLQELKDRFRGERIFILGNGPGLNKVDLAKLENEFIFGVNRISLLMDRVKWTPTFFTAFDTTVVPDNAEEFRQLRAELKFFSARYKKEFGDLDNVVWHHVKGFYTGFDASFGPYVPWVGFGGGGTIVTIAIELAVYLGFTEIYLLGMDLSWSIPKTVVQRGEKMPDGTRLDLTSQFDDDVNHFDSRYFGKGKKWHSPNPLDMKVGLSRAHRYCSSVGVSLVNASEGGELNQIPRVHFASLFEAGD